jgi:hypothetical protein
VTQNPRDPESRLNIVEGDISCLFAGWIITPMIVLFAWTLLWASGCTDMKSPIVPDRISFKEWKERINPTQPPKE